MKIDKAFVIKALILIFIISLGLIVNFGLININPEKAGEMTGTLIFFLVPIIIGVWAGIEWARRKKSKAERNKKGKDIMEQMKKDFKNRK